MARPLPDNDAANLNASARGAERRTLDAIFRHPLAHNLSWRDVVSLFTAIGDAEPMADGDVSFTVAGEHLSVKRPHNKDLSSGEVMDLRHVLTRAGWSPDALASKGAPLQKTGLDLIVIIDHAGAAVHRIKHDLDHAFGMMADVPTRISRYSETTTDADRDESYPADERFFEAVSKALATGDKIVLIGHATCQSNEAEHLSAYLRAHHKTIHSRIMREIVADLPHKTIPELLRLGIAKIEGK